MTVKWGTRFCALVVTVALSGCATTGDRKMVRVIERLETSFNTKDGIVLAPKRVRAWVEDIERDASAASLVWRGVDGQTLQSFSISPNSTTLTFALIEVIENKLASEGGVPTVNSRYSSTLRSISSSGGGVSQLTTGRWLDFNPTSGPPGYITFDSNRTRPDGRDLFRIEAGRAGGVSVIRQTNDGYSYAPSVGENDKVVFEFKPDYRTRGLQLELTAPQIWSVGGGNGYPTQLREGSSPSLSPDGSMIAFVGENGQIWTMTAGGGNPIQVTSTPLPKDKLNGSVMPKRDPCWTPDGTNIIYAAADGKDSQQYSNYDIWVTPRNGGNSKQLTTNGSEDFRPVVDPEGGFVYFISNRGFVPGIWRVSLAGV